MQHVALQCNHALSLALLLPMRTLLSYTAWHVTAANAARTNAAIHAWLTQRSDEGRRAVWHASQLTSSIQQLSTKGQHEGMSLIMAAITLWCWVDHNKIDNSTPRCIESGSALTLRLDRALHLDRHSDRGNDDCRLAAEWVCSDVSYTRPFLLGVGSLLDSNADLRVIRNCIGILDKRRDWTLNQCLKLTLVEQFKVKRKLV